MSSEVDIQKLKDEFTEKLDKAVDNLRNDFATLYLGRASPRLLDGVRVDYYGVMSKLNVVCGINTPDSTTLVLDVWDAKLISKVEKAILSANLDMNPVVNGQSIVLRTPLLSDEGREEVVKKAKVFAEKTKSVMRNIRQKFLNELKVLKQQKMLSMDEISKEESNFEKLFKSYISTLDKLLEQKTLDIKGKK